MNYLLMTPVRNEENNLPTAAQSILKQSHRPALWLIVNDGSTDRTQEIIDELTANNSWIISRSLPPGPGGLGKHFAEVVDYGFTQLQLAAEKAGITYELMGKIDADVLFDSSCFELLVQEFDKSASLGIASPSMVIYEGNKGKVNKEIEIVLGDHPTDGIRLYRRQCFEQIGGIQIVRAPETVAEARAVTKGWKLCRFEHIQANMLRKTHESTSLWARWVMRGAESYYLGYHPLIVLGHCAHTALFNHPKYLFLAYGWGYLKSLIQRKPKIEDEEVLFYFRFRRLREIFPQIPQILWKGSRRWVRRLPS
ncbi:MAG: glycosyltransferase family 2 protein [Anaerolineae bacterium]|nr:glycosyltransferase family 2 protein [Anaerolineae bacterium]